MTIFRALSSKAESTSSRPRHPPDCLVEMQQPVAAVSATAAEVNRAAKRPQSSRKTLHASA
jgi:hypothetical protein